MVAKPGNTLSPLFAMHWGHRPIQTLGKTSPERSTGSHISIIGHITKPELRKMMTRTEMANGFANRFLLLCLADPKNCHSAAICRPMNWTGSVN